MDISRAVMACNRFMGVDLPEEGDVSVIYDDSIIQDTASEKQQAMAEVAAGLMTRGEHRSRWYGGAAGGGAREGSSLPAFPNRAACSNVTVVSRSAASNIISMRSPPRSSLARRPCFRA